MSQTKAKRIIVVDDDADYVLQTKMRLEGAGYEVTTADSRASARELVEIGGFDLAVIDLMMEEMDAGFMLAHEMKKKHPDMPIIMITSVTAETGIYFNTQDSGANSWIKADLVLAKPVRPEQLLEQIARLLA